MTSSPLSRRAGIVMPSITATVSFSKTTVMFCPGLTVPSLTNPRYRPIRITPCESWPHRLESTRCRATHAASASEQPLAAKIFVTTLCSASA